MRAARLAGLALVLAACGSTSEGLEPGVAPAPDAPPIERALAALDARSILCDVEFLADDVLAGRDSPSLGLSASARYFVARMQRLGWEPGCSEGWLHSYELAGRRLLEGGVHAELGPEGAARELAAGTERAVHHLDACSGEWAGPLVHAGSGRERELARLDLEGRWAVVGGQRYGRRRRLSDLAREAGALGLVLLPRNEEETPPFERWSEISARARPGPPIGDGEQACFPSLWLGPGVLEVADGTELGAELGPRLALRVEGPGPVPMTNVAALWRGRHPELAREVIVVSAHYDHVGVNDEGEVMNGADDNASGSAGLLALGEALTVYGPLERSVLLLWVSAEELGLYGSQAWAQDPRLPQGLVPVANINMDMIGRNAPEYFEATPSPEHKAYGTLTRAVMRHIEAEGFEGPTWVDRDWNRSDQASFHKYLEIPAVYVSAGEHEDYHQPTDTVDKIDAQKIARVIGVVLRVLDELQAAPLGP